MLSNSTTAPCAVATPDMVTGMLRRALVGLRIGDLAFALFDRLPRLQVVAERLLWLVPPKVVYPDTDISITYTCLKTAIAAAAREPGERAAAVFIGQLLANATRLLEVEVATASTRWDPRRDHPLPEWEQVHGESAITALRGNEFELASPLSFAGMLSYRILDPTDMRYLTMAADEGLFGEMAGMAA